MSPHRYIHHVTLTSGHVRRSPRSEVSDGVVAVLRPLLDLAMTGEHAPIPGPYPWTMTGGVHGRCCAVTVWAADELTGGGTKPGRTPVVTVGVAPHSRCGAHLWRVLHDVPPGSVVVTDATQVPPEPWCAARLDIGAAMIGPDALAMLGDLERCIAWAWMGMRSE